MKAFLRLITLTSALALSLVFPGFAAEPEGLGPDKWHTTVQDTVKDILYRMPEKDKELVRKTKKRRPHNVPPWLGNRYPQLLRIMARQPKANYIGLRNAMPS
jgi:hypothetical protein